MSTCLSPLLHTLFARGRPRRTFRWSLRSQPARFGRHHVRVRRRYAYAFPTTLFASLVTNNPLSALPNSGNEFDGRLGLRISSIFVILVGSALGAVFPVYASRHRGTGVPEWAFFIAKYFGSGVIVATAFIHARPSLHPAGHMRVTDVSSSYLHPPRRH